MFTIKDLIVALTCGLALAWGALALANPRQDQDQTQKQGQEQSQKQSQTANGGTGIGVGIGYGGEGGAAQADASADSESASSAEASANNAGNSQNVTFADAREAPGVAQGAVVIPTCGAGGNAGGSSTQGAAFLGLAYVPAKCYDLMYAGAYAALGQVQAACDILKGGKFGKRAKRNGITLPEVCEGPTVPAAPEAVDLTGLVTKQELKEHERRIVQKLSEK